MTWDQLTVPWEYAEDVCFPGGWVREALVGGSSETLRSSVVVAPDELWAWVDLGPVRGQMMLTPHISTHLCAVNR